MKILIIILLFVSCSDSMDIPDKWDFTYHLNRTITETRRSTGQVLSVFKTHQILHESKSITTSQLDGLKVRFPNKVDVKLEENGGDQNIETRTVLTQEIIRR